MYQHPSAYPAHNSLKFRKQIEAFRETIHAEIHPMQMLVFLEVINNPPMTVSVSYINDLLVITQAAASRHCRALTERYSPSRDGYGLCTWIQCPKDFRSKYLQLTEKGLLVAEKLRANFQK
ncbi:hypothetical protein ABT56_00020 [Photobacterium aquae]|uniref:MarR family transcriptional regulator n=2 Tax=Photobacterium aquae TaxID=1195763 RepID=A0A0J1HD82_9GAMM|nr:hypothetical protein ABT56_00020 [Photobacterium aquae]